MRAGFASAIFDALERRWESHAARRLVADGLVVVFVVTLLVIELGRRGLLPAALAPEQPQSHFHAVQVAFYLLLGYEVIGLVFGLARSVANAAGKQVRDLLPHPPAAVLRALRPPRRAAGLVGGAGGGPGDAGRLRGRARHLRPARLLLPPAAAPAALARHPRPAELHRGQEGDRAPPPGALRGRRRLGARQPVRPRAAQGAVLRDALHAPHLRRHPGGPHLDPLQLHLPGGLPELRRGGLDRPAAAGALGAALPERGAGRRPRRPSRSVSPSLTTPGRPTRRVRRRRAPAAAEEALTARRVAFRSGRRTGGPRRPCARRAPSGGRAPSRSRARARRS